MTDETPVTSGETAPKNSLDTPTDTGLPRIRTYAADMSKVIKARGETLASIVNKEKVENKRRTFQKKSEPLSPKRIAIFVGTTVLALAGVGILIGVFVFSPNDGTTVRTSAIIFANETFEVTANPDGLFIDQLAAVKRDQNLLLGEVMRVDLFENNMPITGSALATRIGIPNSLAREVTDAMVGIHAFDRNQPFIILRIATYDRSFGAMLDWEREMGRDLAGFFAPTGEVIRSAPLLTFTDQVIRNLDVRRSGADWPILYTFPDQGLLIITTNEFTLREITTRLGASQASF